MCVSCWSCFRKQRPCAESSRQGDYGVSDTVKGLQKRGDPVNEAVQSLGYGLVALLFCIAISVLCQKIKKIAFWFLRHERSYPHKKR